MSLSQEEVAEMGKDILKSDVTSSFLLASLKKLKAGITPSEDLLRTTKIGVAVARLKQSKDTEVQRQATQLVASWRSAIKSKEKKPQAIGAGTPSRSSTPSVGTAGATAGSPARPQQLQVPAQQAKSKVPPEKRDADTDGVDVNKTGDKARDGCVKLMYNGLAFMSEEGEATPAHRTRENNC